MIIKTIFFLDVMYYYSHLFYKKLLNQISPSIQPSIILGGIVGIPLGFLVDTVYIYLSCKAPNPWLFISSCLGCMIFMLYFYEYKDRKSKVIKNEPRFFKSKRINLFLTIFIDFVVILLLFLNGIVGKYLLNSCQ